MRATLFLRRRCRSIFLPAFMLLLSGCDGEAQKDYDAAKAIDKPEAYDAFIQKHPDSDMVRFALLKLDDYHYEQARLKNDEGTWRRFLAQHAVGKYVAEAQAALEQLLYFRAIENGTKQALDAFVQEFPTSNFTPILQKRIANLPILSKLSLADVKIQPANLQDNPKGPKDGTGFFITLKNDSEIVLKRVVVKLLLLHPDGRVWDQREIIPVMGAGEWGPRAYKSPLKPGDSRRFSYVTQRLPPDWKQDYTLFVLSFE